MLNPSRPHCFHFFALGNLDIKAGGLKLIPPGHKACRQATLTLLILETHIAQT